MDWAACCRRVGPGARNTYSPCCDKSLQDVDLETGLVPPLKLSRYGERSCKQRCCCGALLLLMVGLARAVFVRSRLEVDCFPNDKVGTAFPIIPEHFPPEWYGVLWMDTDGKYGLGDGSSSSGSLAMSMADSDYDSEERLIFTHPRGGSWALANNAEGYMHYFWSQFFDFSYTFHLSEDHSKAQVYPTLALWGGSLGHLYMPRLLANYTMVIQRPDPELHCPVEKDAVRAEVSACAKWKQTARYFDLIPALSDFIGTWTTYGYEVVDASGSRVQPAFDAYVAHANSMSSPSQQAATFWLGLDLSEGQCSSPYSSFKGND